jgi:hypothetical protein
MRIKTRSGCPQAEVRAGHLAEVNITEKELAGQLKEGAAKARGGNRQITTTRLPNMDDPALLKDLEAQQVEGIPPRVQRKDIDMEVAGLRFE